MQRECRGEPSLTVGYPLCAGIDVGKKDIYVAVAEDAVVENVRTFGTYTAALTQMNVQSDNVLSELVDKSGLAILRSIVAGERDPSVLAQHRDGRIRATEAEVARSLEGNWRDEHLHELAARSVILTSWNRKFNNSNC